MVEEVDKVDKVEEVEGLGLQPIRVSNRMAVQATDGFMVY